MTLLPFIILAILAVGAIFERWIEYIIVESPDGWEDDETGFHYGIRNGTTKRNN